VLGITFYQVTHSINAPETQRVVPFQEKVHIDRSHSTAIQDALNKINSSGGKTTAPYDSDEEDLRRQEEFEKRLAAEREKELAIKQAHQQQQQKVVDDKQTIDDLLNQYISKAQNPEPID
jgi:hypothetical protein